MAGLAWGVKQSFRAYVAATGGETALTGGAAEAADGALAFPPAADPGDLALGAPPTGTGRFAGGVRFTAHGGMLSVAFADPWIEADRGMLSVADAGGRRVDFATLDVAAAVAEADGTVVVPVAITLDGMMILGDHYPPGTALDAVLLGLG